MDGDAHDETLGEVAGDASLQRLDLPQQVEPGLDGPAGGVLLAAGEAEVGEHAVALVVVDLAAMALHRPLHGLVEGDVDLVDGLGVLAVAEAAGVLLIAHQHRELTELR